MNTTPVCCTVPNCSKIKRCKGYCQAHYKRFKRYGDPLAGRNSPGQCGRYKNSNGYILLSNKWEVPGSYGNGSILEHIYIMSEHLGRPLVSGENVHHKNGIRDDNRLENLELWNTHQPNGQRVEDKVAYAIEILRLYNPELLK